MTALLTFRDAIARHAPGDGTFATALPGVTLIRCASPTLPMPVIYEPTVCFVAQGRKRAALGERVFHYDPASYLVATVGLPVMGAVVEASEAAPYLCMQLDLDPALLGELTLQHARPLSAAMDDSAGLTLGAMTSPLLEAVARLLKLLDTPQDIAPLAPLALRELLYRLISGEHGDVFHHMARTDTRQAQIARAILWLRANYRDASRIETLAEVAGMSRSSFHAHFKAVTAMSPLDFRGQLRMQEARRLMVGEGLNAATAGHRVGYDSPSQFSREYARLFGLPPARDAQRLRQPD
ncbi:AraC family transcriptional regulator [Stenotrophomonas sp.]|uniref:AraC family transcriptional regulator n=1 Tax=Stenotrophomonas sp. TaxID=69392 RepID=UPI0028A8B8DD|nr:AraC family transcriptional regulator [Stenotrophomonas sp.]